MKFLKIIGIVVLLILVVFVIASLVAPASLIVERSIVINRSAATVFGEVNDLSRWPAWSPWEEMDSTMVSTIGEISTGVGATVTWIDENGGGKQEIIESKEFNYLKTALEFNGWDGVSYSEWSFEETGDSTKVTWAFNGSESPFYSRCFNWVIQGMLEENYELGLKNLKEVVEAKARVVIKDIGSEVFESDLNATQYIITMVDTTTPDGIAAVYERSYSAIGAFMAEKGLEKEAAPVGIYHYYSDSLVILEAGIPIAEAVEVPEGMIMLIIEPTKVASATHVGPWDEIGRTHEAIEKWIEEHGAEMNGYPWHVYFNSMDEVDDPAQLYTQVHYPIK